MLFEGVLIVNFNILLSFLPRFHWKNYEDYLQKQNRLNIAISENLLT